MAPSTSLPVTRLLEQSSGLGQHTAITEPQQLVIYDSTSLQRWWVHAWQKMSHPPAIPDVDFSRDMVVVVAAGSCPTSGYGIMIESASISGDTITIVVRSTSPPPGLAVLEVITSPVDVARFPRQNGAIQFRFVS